MTFSPTQLVQKHLRKITDLPVVSKVPADRPDWFVRVDQGTPRRINLDQLETTVIVQVYGTARAQALKTAAELYKGLEFSLEYDDNVSSWDDFNGPYEFPDPDIPHVFRWQFTGELITTLDY